MSSNNLPDLQDDNHPVPKKLPDHLKLIQDIRETPWRYDFFAMARRFQASHDGPGFGYSVRPKQDPVRFGQYPLMEFPTRSIHSLNSDGERLKVKLLFSGLFGTNAPLPYHLTELVNDRRQHHNDDTIAAFADIFHHRFFSVFYRAWADSDPVLSMDEGAGSRQDVFEKFIGAIGGTFLSESEDFEDVGRRYYMGHIGPSSARPEALEKILSDHTGETIEIVEFIGTWLSIEPEDRVSLGMTGLGDGKVLGDSVFSPSSAFEIKVGPLDRDAYETFLPTGANAGLLREIVTATIGLEMEWRVRLCRNTETIPPMSLGKAGFGRLGYDVWMGQNDDKRVCEDLVLSCERYGIKRINFEEKISG